MTYVHACPHPQHSPHKTHKKYPSTEPLAARCWCESEINTAARGFMFFKARPQVALFLGRSTIRPGSESGQLKRPAAKSWRFVAFVANLARAVRDRATPGTPLTCYGPRGFHLMGSLGLAGRRRPNRGSRLCRSRRWPGDRGTGASVRTIRLNATMPEGESRTARTRP